jgi:hypothetical protein
LLSPAIFSFFATPKQITTAGQSSIVSVGTVGCF